MRNNVLGDLYALNAEAAMACMKFCRLLYHRMHSFISQPASFSFDKHDFTCLAVSTHCGTTYHCVFVFFFSQHSCSRETVNVLMNVSKMRTSTQMGWNLAQNINCGAQFDWPKTQRAQLKVFEFPVGSK